MPGKWYNCMNIALNTREFCQLTESWVSLYILVDCATISCLWRGVLFEQLISSPGHEIPCTLWNPKFHYTIHNSTHSSQSWVGQIKSMRTALFWVITQRVVVISYRRFGTTCRFHLQGSRIQTFGRAQFSSTSRRKPEITHKSSPCSAIQFLEDAMYVI